MIGRSYYKRLNNSSKILFSEFEYDRQKALEDRYPYLDRLETLEVSFPQGGGKTNYRTYEIKTVFNEDTFDIRKLPDRR